MTTNCESDDSINLRSSQRRAYMSSHSRRTHLNGHRSLSSGSANDPFDTGRGDSHLEPERMDGVIAAGNHVAHAKQGCNAAERQRGRPCDVGPRACEPSATGLRSAGREDGKHHWPRRRRQNSPMYGRPAQTCRMRSKSARDHSRSRPERRRWAHWHFEPRES